jgi:hypothetical protein
VHDLGSHCGGGASRPSATRGILLNTREPLLGETAAPLAHGLHTRLQFGGYLLIQLSGGRQEHDLCTQYQPRRRAASARPPLQGSSIRIRQHNRRCNSHAFILLMNVTTCNQPNKFPYQ